MFSLQITTFLVVAADLTLGGLISNGFIATVITQKWIKCRSLTSSDQLLLIMGITNFFAIILQTASVISENAFICSNHLILPTIFSFVFFVTFFRFWLTAWLSLFYCIKIVNSTHVLFVWCKMRLSWLINRLLLGSLLVSLVISIFAFPEFLFELQSNRTASIANRTQEQTLRKTVDNYKVLFLVIGTSCPLLVVLFCSILSIVSLGRHIRRMRSEKSSFRSIQAEAHVKAARTMLSLLLIYVLFYVGETLNLTIRFGDGQQIFAVFVVLLYSQAQAAVLVLVNSKLKRTATQILQRISQELCRHTASSQV